MDQDAYDRTPTRNWKISSWFLALRASKCSLTKPTQTFQAPFSLSYPPHHHFPFSSQTEIITRAHLHFLTSHCLLGWLQFNSLTWSRCWDSWPSLQILSGRDPKANWHQGPGGKQAAARSKRSLSTSASTLQPVGSCPHAAMPTSRGGVTSALWTVLRLFTLGTNRSLIAETGGAGPRCPDCRITLSLQFRPRTVLLSCAHTPPIFSPFLVVTDMSHAHTVLSSSFSLNWGVATIGSWTFKIFATQNLHVMAVNTHTHTYT